MRLETDLGISIDIGIDIELRARTPLLRHPLDATHLLQRRVRAPYHAHLAQLRHRVTLPLPRARVCAQRLGEEDGHAPAMPDELHRPDGDGEACVA